MNTFWQDLRYGTRSLLKKPGFTAVAIATLALGIGVNTALFTCFNLFLRPKPVKNPDSLLTLEYRGQGRGSSFSYPDYERLRDQTQVFTDVTASFHEKFLLGATGRGIEPEEIEGDFVSDNFFSTLGADAMLGRTFSAEENRVPDRDAVVMLSHHFWQQRLSRDPQVIGRTLLLNGRPFTVIGVTNPQFIGLSLQVPDIWLPLMMRPSLATVFFEEVSPENRDWLAGQGFRWLTLQARLGPQRTMAEAQAEMTLLLPRLAAVNPAVEPSDSILLTPVSEFEGGTEGWELMAMVLGAGLLVLLIACSNIANMLLARAAARQREIGIRLCLGASRGRIIGQLLTESLILAMLGGGAGLLVSWWSLDLLGRVVLSRYGIQNATRLVLDLSPDARVLAFSLLLSALSALAFGLVPALRATASDPLTVIRDGGARAGARLSGSRLRGGLVVGQVALCLVLLIPAGLLLRGVKHGLSTAPGFDARQVIAVGYSLELSGYDVQRARLFQHQLMARLGALPGVESVSPDRTFGGRVTVTLRDQNGAGDKQFGGVPFEWVTSDYFRTIGIKVVEGRDFTRREVEEKAPVAIVSESTAHALWPNQNPVGQAIRVERSLRDGRVQVIESSAEVVGVARDNQSQGVGQLAPLFFYLPQDPVEWLDTTLLVRTFDDAAGLKEMVRRETYAAEPVLRLGVATLDEQIAKDKRVLSARAASELAGCLGGLALILAAGGLYGVMSYSVAQRTREIGIRVAVGAQRSDVFRLVLGQGMKLVLLGLLIGNAASFVETRALKSFLFGLSAADPPTFAGAAILLTLVALVACWIPALRAVRVDPMVALRYE
jgi:putative ABC transport system permease protein